MPKKLAEGDRAPGFDAPTDGGGTVSLKALAGKKVVLYFYPKDDTSGCTKEAIDFSQRLADFRRAGAVVIGASKDSITAHDKFKSKHDLKVTLACDPEAKLIAAYGSWIEKSMYGRKYMGIDRSTFLIDGKGVVRKIWRKVRVAGHVQEVLEAAKEI